ncbi:hypothetical protein [Roseibium sp.]|uniref:hypothetical protein n=1 Tax=Roseibium sp. TaxID=1936156 RepID=UPI003262DC7E
MGQQIASFERRTIGQLAHLAACLARPLDFLHEDHLSLPPLDAVALRRLAGQPPFRGPLNRAVSKNLGLPELSFGQELANKLETNEDTQIAVRLLQIDPALVLDFARHCAAVQLFPQIRSCVLKSQRKRIEDVLGKDAFLAAVRETPAFYPGLPERSRAVRLSDVFATETSASSPPEAETEAGAEAAAPASPADIHPAIREGLATLVAFVRSADRGCASLFSWRFPRSTAGEHIKAQVLSAEQSSELKMLLKHRGLTW